ncbi:autoinducer binding domain-containing protein [Neorhizobium sp. DT-125]|uniref:autoinducer binding domain-containing protein n=1 Tax=Neorhizobium sp. DT-125 TaxID=3396163 RepID=UPI003F1D45BB
MDHWFERLIEQLALASGEDGVKATFEKLTREAGFDAYAYLNFQASTQTAISNYDLKWQARYRDQGFVAIDPVVRAARARYEPFAWSNRSTTRMTGEHRKFYQEAAEFGIRSGITVPIKTGYGLMAMLTLASREADFAGGKKLNPVLAAAAFGQVHSRLELMQLKANRDRNVHLKPNELTCLRWSAEGKSMRAIAIIENTTFSNVSFFLNNAKKALRATSLPQATALAKELGLI